MKTEAIRFYQTGTKEVLKFEEIDLPEPKENEVLISQKFIGVNFIDTYYRSGLYPVQLPSGLGTEASGLITPHIDSVFKLKDAAIAHQELLERSRVGTILLEV